MFTAFDADTADDLWLDIATAFREGKGQAVEGRGGKIDEILHCSLCLRDPRQRWIGSRTPALSPAFALAEVVWILLGRNDSAFLNYFNSALPNYAGKGPTFHGAYGHRLVNLWQFDQLKQAYLALKADPSTRQIVLQIWNPQSDLPQADGLPRAADIPCNLCSILKIQGGRLEWTQIMRSNDVFRGLPFNLVQFTTLHELMAGWLGLQLGHYHHLSDSLHVYRSSKANVVEAMPATAPSNTDHLTDSYEETMRSVQLLGELVDLAIAGMISAERLVRRLDEMILSGAWRNIGAVLVAEACRKRRNRTQYDLCLGQCTNPTYRELARRWDIRCGSRSRG